ncbi:MAG TPA: CpsB/CapC family capsule biosynthesis tyrosine phosphatase [Longimicrobiales bacterium]|nr:CpsB/CapC family capsule biosynthesis tyrosine phosphatase [Longimicrobiales bacterium]
MTDTTRPSSARDIVDFHNHVIPAVDDGASDDAEAAAALEALSAHGVVQLVATPHVDGSLTLRPDALRERLTVIDAGWARLSALVARTGALRVRRGAEVMLDTPEPDLSDARLRLDGGRFALVEYPFMTVPPQSVRVIDFLLHAGVTPIIAHPERYAGITPAVTLPAAWRDAGAYLQVNAGSLTGRYGEQPRAHAFALLERGLVDYLCSDYHARGRPAITSARNLLIELNGAEQAALLMSVNPRRMLNGEAPIPVPPWRPKQGVWERLRRRWAR